MKYERLNLFSEACSLMCNAGETELSINMSTERAGLEPLNWEEQNFRLDFDLPDVFWLYILKAMAYQALMGNVWGFENTQIEACVMLEKKYIWNCFNKAAVSEKEMY